MPPGSELAALAYGAFALVFLVLPGIAVQLLLRLPVDAALVLPAGFVVLAGAQWLGLLTGLPVAPLLALAALTVVVARRRAVSREAGPSLSGAIPAVLAILALLATTQATVNRLGADGALLIDPVLREDSAFHAALGWELSHEFPAQVPGLAGIPLGYHYGLPLIQGAALQWASVHPLDSLNRGAPALVAIALVLALRGVVALLGGGGRAVTLAGFGPVAGGVFLFLDRTRWSELLPIDLTNNLCASAAVGLGCLIAMERHRADGRKSRLALALLLGFATPIFKGYVGAQLLLGLAAAALLSGQRRSSVAVGLAMALAVVMLMAGPAGASQAVYLDPLGWARDERRHLDLPPLEGMALLAWLAGNTALTLGLRVAGIPALFRGVFGASALRVSLAGTTLAGFALGHLFRVTDPRGVARGETLMGAAPNNAGYFLELSHLLLWIFSALVLGRLLESKRWTRALPLLCVLALPQTVLSVVGWHSLAPVRVPPSVMRAMAVLEAASRPGDVVLESPGPRRFPPAPLFVGRRVARSQYLRYSSQYTSEAELARRSALIERFFAATDPAQARASARQLGASFVCLYSRDRVSFPETALLSPLYEGPGVRLFRLAR